MSREERLAALLESAHLALWLNALEPVDEKEKISQEKLGALMGEIENILGRAK